MASRGGSKGKNPATPMLSEARERIDGDREKLPVASNAEAARRARLADDAAAIAGESAGHVYGLKIESRPSHAGLWQYAFFIDVAGHVDDAPVRQALSELGDYAADVKILGSLLSKYPNLVVTRTFSKAYGLAGLRVGYACAHPALLRVLERVRESFNVNTPGLAACAAVLADQAHLHSVRRGNADEREWLAGQLLDRGLLVAPSQTNFLLADFGRDAASLESELVRRGVVLRPMAGYGLQTCLRITVGTRQQNLRLLHSLDEVLA